MVARCVVCNQRLTGRQREYCSPECRHAITCGAAAIEQRRVEAWSCRVCGKALKGRQKMFCSVECQAAAPRKCKVCGRTDDLQPVTIKGKTYNREYCREHWAAQMAKTRGTKNPRSTGCKKVVVIPEGVIRHTIRRTTGKVITSEYGREREINYRTLKRIRTPEAIERALRSMGFEVIKRNTYEIVLEKRVA